VEPERTTAPAESGRGPTWFPVAALWTLGSTWLAAIGVLFYSEFLDNDVSENVAWALLGVGTVGFVFTLAAFTTATTRRDVTLAWAALALALAFTIMGGGPLLFYGFGAE
jgi:hypothetical protein